MECLKLYCTAVAVVVIQTLSTDSLWPSCEEGSKFKLLYYNTPGPVMHMVITFRNHFH